MQRVRISLLFTECLSHSPERSNGTIVYTFNKYIEDAVNSLQAKSAKVIVSSQTPDNPYNTSFSPSRFVGYAETAAKDTGAWYVDHFDLVIEEYEALGETAVNALYPVGQCILPWYSVLGD